MQPGPACRSAWRHRLWRLSRAGRCKSYCQPICARCTSRALQLHLPFGVDPSALNRYNSFPSDHAALLFGLAATIWLVHGRAGIAAFVWAAVVNLGRAYELYHFPSDIVGGAALGVLAVCLAQNRLALGAGGWTLCWATRAPGSFYATGFVFSYLLATLFEDLRTLGRGPVKALVAHFLNAGN